MKRAPQKKINIVGPVNEAKRESTLTVSNRYVNPSVNGYLLSSDGYFAFDSVRLRRGGTRAETAPRRFSLVA